MSTQALSQVGSSTAPSRHPSFAALTTLSIALLSISFAPILIRFSETELSANATVFNRFLIFSVLFGGSKLIRNSLPLRKNSSESISVTVQGEQQNQGKQPGQEKQPELWQWLLLSSVGLISCLSLVLWAISLEHTTVAKSMLLNNLTPFFTSLGSWLLLGRKFDQRFLAGLAIALAGALYLGLDDLTSSDGLLIGDLYALLSAAFLGGYFLVVERLRDCFSATTILLWRCATGALLLLPLIVMTGGTVFPQTAIAALAVLGLGIVSEGLGQRLLADCMSQLSCSFVSLFLLLEPILSALLAWSIFGEQLTMQTGIGFAIVLGGIYLAQSSDSAVLHEG